MKAIVEYFNGEEVQLYPGIIGIKVNKIGEDEIEINSEDEIENLSLKDGIAYVHNSAPLYLKGVNTKYVLPKPLKLLRLGIPTSLENAEQVQVNYLTFFDKDYVLVGFNLTDDFKEPFAILEFDEGYTKVVLKDEFSEVKPKKEKIKKAKRKKKGAKRASKKQKAKSKSARKSRRV
ncbi:MULTISPECIES: hypothetical protein [Sulfurisphaera]|uniref:Uncharacterized protein n=1 Tax=Sulfurisphaera tokodaii TaxID=111955 RepID=A0A832T0W6_9CREN|nr:hypothetical protein [Sulfurisphaera tokodaii]HII73242.1 hypothetical protein [Sulfurisphaera tokodaii]